MIVDKFKLRSDTLGDVAVFDLLNMTSESPYVLKGLTGISASEITPNSYAYSVNGVKYYDMSPGTRDISMKIGLNPLYSSTGVREDLRDELYKSIASSRSPVLYLDAYQGSNFIATISGLPTKLEASHFTDKPEVDLTIRCEDAFFKRPVRTTVAVEAFSSTQMSINYQNGNAPVGFTATFLITSPISSFGFLSLDGSWEFSITHSFLTGDIISFSSEENSKGVSVYRASEVVGSNTGITQLADKITSTSIWPIIFPGQNTFVISANVTSFDFLTCSYNASFWGV